MNKFSYFLITAFIAIYIIKYRRPNKTIIHNTLKLRIIIQIVMLTYDPTILVDA